MDIKFPQWNFNQSETRIGDKKLSVKLYAWFESQVAINSAVYYDSSFPFPIISQELSFLSFSNSFFIQNFYLDLFSSLQRK